MVKPAMVYGLTATCLFLFLLTSRTPKHKAGRRLAHHHLYPAFDPLVGQFERRVVERGLLDVHAFRERLNREFGATLEEYFGEDGRINTTERLAYLFPLLDQSPKDGVVSFEELDVWNRRQAMDRLVHSTGRRMRVHDRDRDGVITLSEFLSYIPDEEREWNNMEHGKAGWWKEQFLNADKDGNESLNETEFNDFLHPEDSSNPKIQMWLQREKIREMDQNQDGKLSFTEFRERTSSIYKYYTEFETLKDGKLQQHQTNAEQNFAELDMNKDTFLTADELKPIIHQLHPGELSHATYYTKYLMNEADDNKDGKLTLEEMRKHHHAFYNAVVEKGHNVDDDDDYDFEDHDELR